MLYQRPGEGRSTPSGRPWVQALERKGLHSGAELMEGRREGSWVGLTGEKGNPVDALGAKPGNLG